MLIGDQNGKGWKARLMWWMLKWVFKVKNQRFKQKFTCPKPTIEPLEKGIKYVRI